MDWIWTRYGGLCVFFSDVLLTMYLVDRGVSKVAHDV